MSVASLELQLALSKLSTSVDTMRRIEVIPPELFDVAAQVVDAYRKTLAERPRDNVRQILTSLESSLSSEVKPTDGEVAALALARLAIEEIGR